MSIPLGKKDSTYNQLVYEAGAKLPKIPQHRPPKHKRERLLTQEEKGLRHAEQMRRYQDENYKPFNKVRTQCECSKWFTAKSQYQKRCPACQKRKTPLPILYERAVNKRRKRKDL